MLLHHSNLTGSHPGKNFQRANRRSGFILLKIGLDRLDSKCFDFCLPRRAHEGYSRDQTHCHRFLESGSDLNTRFMYTTDVQASHGD